jgi:hypothetical protein
MFCEQIQSFIVSQQVVYCASKGYRRVDLFIDFVLELCSDTFHLHNLWLIKHWNDCVSVPLRKLWKEVLIASFKYWPGGTR